MELCGADGCTSVPVPDGAPEWPGGAGPVADPPPVSPFFEVRVTIEGLRVETLWYVPAARRFAARHDGSVRWSGVWQRVDKVIARAARGSVPLRATPVAATVDGRRAAGKASDYLRLFDLGTTVGRGSESHRFLRLRVETEPPSPWSHDELWFFPSSGVLQRGAELVRVPAGIAAQLRAGGGIESPESDSDGSLVGGSLLIAAGVALSGVLLSRRWLRWPR